MSGLFRYEAVTAKCRCLEGKLLTRAQYEALAQKSTFADAVAYLKDETAYSELLDQVEPASAHRARLEGLLEKHLIDAYTKLYTFTSGAERKFIGSLLQEFEMRYLLDAIRATEYDDSMEFYTIPPFIRERSDINFTRIFRTDSKSEILAALEGTVYYEPLRPVMTAEKCTFAEIESALNRSYYKKLLTKYASVFTGEQKKRVVSAIATKIDLMNISVILRIRRFDSLREGTERVKLDFTSVLPLMIPAFGRLREPELYSICTSELSLSETIDRFTALYKHPAELFGEQNSTGEYGSRFLYERARKLTLCPKPSFDIVFGYLSLLKFETDNIIYILEALRYGTAPEKIGQSIII